MRKKTILMLSLHDANGDEVSAPEYSRMEIRNLQQKIIFPTAVRSWGLLTHGRMWSSRYPDHPVFSMLLNPDGKALLVMAGMTISCKMKLPAGMAKALRSGKELNRGGNVRSEGLRPGDRTRRKATIQDVGDQDGGMRNDA